MLVCVFANSSRTLPQRPSGEKGVSQFLLLWKRGGRFVVVRGGVVLLRKGGRLGQRDSEASKRDGGSALLDKDTSASRLKGVVLDGGKGVLVDGQLEFAL